MDTYSVALGKKKVLILKRRREGGGERGKKGEGRSEKERDRKGRMKEG